MCVYMYVYIYIYIYIYYIHTHIYKSSSRSPTIAGTSTARRTTRTWGVAVLVRATWVRAYDHRAWALLGGAPMFQHDGPVVVCPYLCASESGVGGVRLRPALGCWGPGHLFTGPTLRAEHGLIELEVSRRPFSMSTAICHPPNVGPPLTLRRVSAAARGRAIDPTDRMLPGQHRRSAQEGNPLL